MNSNKSVTNYYYYYYYYYGVTLQNLSIDTILVIIIVFVCIVGIGILLFGFSAAAHESGPHDVDEDVAHEDGGGQDDDVDVGAQVADDHRELQLGGEYEVIS